jgi:hypothetical protein
MQIGFIRKSLFSFKKIPVICLSFKYCSDHILLSALYSINWDLGCRIGIQSYHKAGSTIKMMSKTAQINMTVKWRNGLQICWLEDSKFKEGPWIVSLLAGFYFMICVPLLQLTNRLYFRDPKFFSNSDLRKDSR